MSCCSVERGKNGELNLDAHLWYGWDENKQSDFRIYFFYIKCFCTDFGEEDEEENMICVGSHFSKRQILNYLTDAKMSIYSSKHEEAITFLLVRHMARHRNITVKITRMCSQISSQITACTHTHTCRGRGALAPSISPHRSFSHKRTHELIANED